MSEASAALARNPRYAVLRSPVADLVGARAAAGMTQQQVAARMWTTKKRRVAPRERALRAMTLDTIEKYALAVGARVDIRVRRRW